MIKYTTDGDKVLVVDYVNDKQAIVRKILVTGAGSEVADEQKFVVERTKLCDSPVETWKEKRLRESEQNYKERIDGLERECKEAKKRLKEATTKARLRANELFAFAKNANEEKLRTLKMFLAGEITHVFVASPFTPQIVNADDDKMFMIDSSFSGRREFEALKLISLFGKSNGDIGYWLHQYSDGSGCGYTEIVPCSSYEEALELAQGMVDGLAMEYVENDRHFDINSWKKIDGIVIPEAAQKKAYEKAEVNRQQKIEKLRQELRELEEQA